MILARWPVKNGMFCYTTRHRVKISHGNWMSKKSFLIIILDSARYTQTFNIIPNVRHCATACPGSLVSLGYISLTSLLNVHITVCTMSRQNSVLLQSSLYLHMSHSLLSMHSVTSSTMLSVKIAAKTAKSITKSVKRAIMKGAATAVRTLKKAQTSLSSGASSVDIFSALFLSWWLTIFWFISLEGNDSNVKCPLSSQEDNAKDEPEGETDKQELGAYKLTFAIFLASDPMWL